MKITILNRQDPLTEEDGILYPPPALVCPVAVRFQDHSGNLGDFGRERSAGRIRQALPDYSPATTAARSPCDQRRCRGPHLCRARGRSSWPSRGSQHRAKPVGTAPSTVHCPGLRHELNQYRHLEQVIWSSLLASGLPATEVPDRWRETMEQPSAASYAAYRDLVEQPGLWNFFAGPLRLRRSSNSRSAPGPAGDSLGVLLSRCLVPTWYDLGTPAAQFDNQGSGCGNADQRIRIIREADNRWQQNPRPRLVL